MSQNAPAIKKKVCLLGAFAAGKTSLVRRFVHSIFSEQYHTSVGVKVDRKTVNASGIDVGLLIWDLAGLDEFQDVQPQYLRGSSGFIIVVDGTRRDTFDQGLAIRERALEAVDDAETVIALNKSDLMDEWEIPKNAPAHPLISPGQPVIQTSAKTGHGVEEMFTTLALQMTKRDR